MSVKLWITVMITLGSLISSVSATLVDKTTGPYQISFDMPAVENLTVEIPDPYPSDSLTLYGLTTTADETWFINLVITKYNDAQLPDPEMERRHVGDNENKVTERIIDGRNALVGIGTGSGGTTSDVIYWLDDSNKVDIMIASNYRADNEQFQTVFNSILDTIKINY